MVSSTRSAWRSTGQARLALIRRHSPREFTSDPPFLVTSTSFLTEIAWENRAQGKQIVLEVRFGSPAARLYSFWFANDKCGASHGWVAAGGVGFNASRDLVGSC